MKLKIAKELTEEQVREAIGNAVGAGSMCWDPKPSTQVFDSDQASSMIDEICAKLFEKKSSVHHCSKCGKSHRPKCDKCGATTDLRSYHGPCGKCAFPNGAKTKEASALAVVDELEKIGIDPVSAAAAAAGGKIMLSNALSRWGHKLPPVRWLGQEIAGVGARTALQGKPLLSAPTRTALALGLDAKAVGIYEDAHKLGRMARFVGAGPGALSRVQQQVAGSRIASHFPEAQKFLSNIPLQSTGVRRAIDYGFTPVGQVGQDIAGVARRAIDYGHTPVSQVGRDLISATSRIFRPATKTASVGWGRSVADRALFGAQDQIRGVAKNVGNAGAAFLRPVSSFKTGWRENWNPGGEPLHPAFKAMQVYGLYRGAQEVMPEKDPTGQGRSRIRRATRFVGDQAGGIIGAPFGFSGGLAAAMMGAKAGDVVGAGIDKLRGYKPPQPKEQPHLPPKPQGLQAQD